MSIFRSRFFRKNKIKPLKIVNKSVNVDSQIQRYLLDRYVSDTYVQTGNNISTIIRPWAQNAGL